MKRILFILMALATTYLAKGQCSGIDFYGNKTKACRNEMVRFYAQGVPAGSSYQWYINGNVESTQSTLFYFFTQTGTFGIKLEVTLPDKTVCTVDKPGYITITSPQVDSVVSSKTILCDLNEQVTIKGYGKGIKQWNWIIENNYFTDAGDQINYTFTSEGVKQAKLIILDSNGCLSQFVEDTVAHVTGVMTVNFTDSNSSGCQPLEVVFKPDVSVNKPGQLSYYWLFPGGVPASDSSEFPDTVLYSKPGKNDVSLTVTMANGCSKTLTKPGLVAVGDTVKLEILSDHKNICKVDDVKFYINDTVASPSSLTWSFPGGFVLPYSTADTQFVRYPNSGKYNVALNYNYNGCTAMDTNNSYIDVLDLAAKFNILNPYNCTPPHTVSFQSTSDLPSAGTVWFEWTFYNSNGTGILGKNNLPNPAYTFQNYGRYNIKLTIKQSPRGCADSVLKNNAVIVQPFLAELNNMGTVRACVDQPAFFSIPNSILSYSLYPIDVDWTFYELDGINIKGKKTGRSTSIVYDSGGYYNYKVVVNNNNGCHDSAIFPKKIDITEIVPRFYQDTTHVCNNGSILITENSYPPYSYVNYFKITNLTHPGNDFSKIITSHTFSPTFSYPGIYSTQLVSNKSNCYDTLVVDSNIKISGIYGDFTVQTSALCAGDSTKVTASVSLDENYSTSPDTVTYLWEAIPASGVVISNPAAKSTYISFTADGCYSIRLKLTNGAGCNYEVYKSQVVCVGTKANISLPSAICPGTEYQLSNTSERGLYFNWSASDTAVHFYPGNTVASPKISVSTPGNYQLKMVSSRNTCSDSTTLTFKVQYVTAGFWSADTVNYCAPATATFFADPSDANNYQWFFDNIKINTSDTQVTYYYLTNAGTTDTGYTVRMVATTSAGCRDTVMKSNYIRVVGPVPKFDVLDPNGCNPLTVRFKDQSTNVVSYLFQFDDGNFVENKSFATHTYDISTSTEDSMLFVPRLFAFDTAGCNFVYEGDTISVFQYAQANFSAGKQIGCDPFEATFLNTSLYADQHFWDFENDGVYDDSSQLPSHVYSEGLYSVKLLTTNSHQCNDSLVKTDFINVYKHLESDILTSDTVVCLTTTASFFPEILFSEKNVTNYFWKFFDKNAASDTSTSVNGRHNYSAPGFYDLMLVMSDEYACVDTVMKDSFVYVADTVRPAAVDINYVSVENNSAIRINWDQYTEPDFKQYLLYRSAGAGNFVVYQPYGPEDTTYLDASSNPQVDYFRYLVRVENACSLNSLPSSRQNNILLDASSPRHGTIDFNWSYYNGWPNLVSYDLFRKNPGDTTFYLLSTLQPTDTVFTDNYLCNDNYCYFVKAYDTGAFESKSNIVCLTPDYHLPNLTFARRTTLVNNYLPFTEWVDIDPTPKTNFIVDRKKSNENWVQDYAIVRDTFFYDSLADTKNDFYVYRVRSVDSCGNANNNPTLATNTIFLDVAIDENNLIQLNWNAYPSVVPGKLRYLLEMQDVDSSFKTIATLQAGTTSYTDNQVYKDANRAFCYRIKADFDGDPGYQSVSNIACTLFPSKIYLPSAFSPNGDGLNDYFSVASTSLFEMTGDENVDFTMSIFNQWGEILYATSDPNGYWDGRFKGDYVPAGIYYYAIFARGLDNISYHLSGSISIIR